MRRRTHAHTHTLRRTCTRTRTRMHTRAHTHTRTCVRAEFHIGKCLGRGEGWAHMHCLQEPCNLVPHKLQPGVGQLGGSHTFVAVQASIILHGTARASYVHACASCILSTSAQPCPSLVTPEILDKELQQALDDMQQPSPMPRTLTDMHMRGHCCGQILSTRHRNVQTMLLTGTGTGTGTSTKKEAEHKRLPACLMTWLMQEQLLHHPSYWTHCHTKGSDEHLAIS